VGSLSVLGRNWASGDTDTGETQPAINWTGDNSTTRQEFGNVRLSWPKASLDGEKIVNLSQLRYSLLSRHHTVRT